jgi:hypothetical protein
MIERGSGGGAPGALLAADPRREAWRAATFAGIVRGALAENDLAKIHAVGEFLDDALKHPRAISEIEIAVAILEQDRRESEGP